MQKTVSTRHRVGIARYRRERLEFDEKNDRKSRDTAILGLHRRAAVARKLSEGLYMKRVHLVEDWIAWTGSRIAVIAEKPHGEVIKAGYEIFASRKGEIEELRFAVLYQPVNAPSIILVAEKVSSSVYAEPESLRQVFRMLDVATAIARCAPWRPTAFGYELL